MTLKLLIAGKNVATFQPIKNVFEQEDALIITATSIALALFLSRKNQPALIISQLQLIDGQGLTFYYETRNEPELARIPFALLLTKQDMDFHSTDLHGEKEAKKLFHYLVFENEQQIYDDPVQLKKNILALLK